MPDAAYADRDLNLTKNPGVVPRNMLSFAKNILKKIRWDSRDVTHFLGEYLTTPKPQVVFRPPVRPLPARAFSARLAHSVVVLDEKTQMLYRGGWLFVNGERHRLPGRRFAALADARRLARTRPDPLLYDWYRAGYLRLEPA